MKTNIGVKLLLPFLAGCLGHIVTSCNSDVDYIYSLPSSATIKSFNLEAKASVLPNLDSVFFSIDLYTGEIFNADSLPYGTDISSLTPVITTESASSVEISGFVSTGDEKTYEYLDNTTDTLDFSQPVNVKVVSYDGAYTKNYTITVNVHQVPTDTLVWSKVEGGTLPTTLAAVETQHTTMEPGASMFYCMTYGAGEYCVAHASDPSGVWQVGKPNIDFVADVNSFTATKDALYILSREGDLYSSTDHGMTWTATGSSATYLLGAYGSKLLSTLNGADGWQIAEYPSGVMYAAPVGFPVLNASNATTISFEMATSTQLIITGGRQEDNTITSATWGYDGTNWARISRTGMPVRAENMTLVPYFDVRPDSISWKVSEPTSVLLAMCGNLNDGSLNDTIYMTSDFGLTWKKAPESMQLSSDVIAPRTKAQAFLYTAVETENAVPNSVQSRFEVRNIDWQLLNIQENTRKFELMSRASGPITEWDVPYIYLFGGEDRSGVTFNTVYRGVIRALTFKPLQ